MYELVKFIHIAAAIVWLGAGVTFQILNLRLAGDQQGMETLSSQGEWFGRAVFSTSAVVTLLTGIIAVIVGDWSFAELWITLGFVGVALSIVSGAVFSRRLSTQLSEAVAAEGAASATVAVLQRRLNLVGSIDLLVLFGVAAVMVFKP